MRLGTAARGSGIYQAARSGDVPALRHLLRVAPRSVHEKTKFGRGLKKIAVFCCFPEVEGGFGANSFNSLKFGAERNEFVGFLLHLNCILGLELPDSYY